MHKNARSTARLAAIWVGRTDPDIAREVIRWASLITAATSTYLRYQKDYLLQHADVLSEEEMQWLLSMRQPPIAILQVITTLVRRSGVTPEELLAIEANLNTIDVDIGICERTRSTAMPMAYTAHTSRFLIIFLTLLPIGMVVSLGWHTIFATVIISFLLLGIEHAGIMLEQPLMVLPLSAYAAASRSAVEAVALTQLQIDELFPEGSCVMREGKLSRSATAKFGHLLKGSRSRDLDSSLEVLKE